MQAIISMFDSVWCLRWKTKCMCCECVSKAIISKTWSLLPNFGISFLKNTYFTPFRYEKMSASNSLK